MKNIFKIDKIAAVYLSQNTFTLTAVNGDFVTVDLKYMDGYNPRANGYYFEDDDGTPSYSWDNPEGFSPRQPLGDEPIEGSGRLINSDINHLMLIRHIEVFDYGNQIKLFPDNITKPAITVGMYEVGSAPESLVGQYTWTNEDGTRLFSKANPEETIAEQVARAFDAPTLPPHVTRMIAEAVELNEAILGDQYEEKPKTSLSPAEIEDLHLQIVAMRECLTHISTRIGRAVWMDESAGVAPE